MSSSSCNYVHFLRNSPRGRHTVVLVGEELGVLENKHKISFLTTFDMMNIGNKVPEILGKDEQGQDIRLSDYLGRKLVLYFCTTFVINEEGVIEQIFTGKQVKTKEHAEQILNL